eukprot:2274083-Amphidinium_carterae.1
MVLITPVEMGEPIAVHRFLTQLGFGKPVQLLAVGPEVALTAVQSKVVVPTDHWGEAMLVAGQEYPQAIMSSS